MIDPVRPAPSDGDHDAGSGRAPVIGYLCVTSAMFLVVTGSFAAPWSAGTFVRSSFVEQYRSGVYAPRVLGRELVLWVDARLMDAGARDLLGTVIPADAEMFTALALVNAVAYLALAVVVWDVVTSSLPGAGARGTDGWGSGPEVRSLRSVLVAGGLMTAAALSLSVVTPYDLLALALTMLALRCARLRAPLDLACVPHVVAAVATRESAVIAVAALVVAAMFPLSGVRRSVAAVSVVAGVATYVALRLGTEGSSVTDGLTLALNVDLGAVSVLGVAVAVLVLVGYRSLITTAGIGPGAATTEPQRRPMRAALALFWLLASPYWVTSILTGYWFESLRLLVPLLFVDTWLRLALVDAASRLATDHVDEPVGGPRA